MEYTGKYGDVEMVKFNSSHIFPFLKELRPHDRLQLRYGAQLSKDGIMDFYSFSTKFERPVIAFGKHGEPLFWAGVHKIPHLPEGTNNYVLGFFTTVHFQKYKLTFVRHADEAIAKYLRGLPIDNFVNDCMIENRLHLHFLKHFGAIFFRAYPGAGPDGTTVLSFLIPNKWKQL